MAGLASAAKAVAEQSLGLQNIIHSEGFINNK